MNEKNNMTLNEMFGEKAQLLEKARRLTDDELFEYASFLPVGRVKKLKKAEVEESRL